MVKKQEPIQDPKRENHKLSAMICLTLISIVSLIGCFFGQDGFRYVGIGMAILAMAAIVFLSEYHMSS